MDICILGATSENEKIWSCDSMWLQKPKYFEIWPFFELAPVHKQFAIASKLMFQEISARLKYGHTLRLSGRETSLLQSVLSYLQDIGYGDNEVYAKLGIRRTYKKEHYGFSAEQLDEVDEARAWFTDRTQLPYKFPWFRDHKDRTSQKLVNSGGSDPQPAERSGDLTEEQMRRLRQHYKDKVFSLVKH